MDPEFPCETQLPQQEVKPAVTGDDEYAISVAKTEYREAYNTGDITRLLNVFSDSFSNMSEGEPSFYGAEGKEALRSQAEKLFREYRANIEVVVIAVNVLGDVAYDCGWHRLTLIPKAGGNTEVVRYRYCEIWRKQATGEWKIVFFISNKDHEPAMLDGLKG
jgi:ketosteroid isomerase-like protein